MLADNHDELQSPECERFTFRGSGLPDDEMKAVLAIEHTLEDGLAQGTFGALKHSVERGIGGLREIVQRRAVRA